ncbi:MAG TPA: hypothetical protein VH640_08770, partial [Bryobacteraceae bacterium]
MAVTKSWTAAGTAPAALAVEAAPRPRSELKWLVGASLLIAAGLAMVFAAKTEGEASLQTAVVNLNTVTSADELEPLFAGANSDLAHDLFSYLQQARPLKNAGAVARHMPRRLFA